MDWKQGGIFLIGGYLAGEAVFKAYDMYLERYSKHKPSEIRFVRNLNKICKGHVFSKKICSEHASKVDSTFQCAYSIILWMVEFFDSATKTLDISIYLVTCEAFRDAILRAFARGVKVRIFTDYIMARGSGSAIGIFITAGIPVNMLKRSRMMHRKSAIADKSRLLMGTGNWTMQALAGNWDFWYQTSDPEVVKKFSKEFEAQWNNSQMLRPTIEEFEDMKHSKLTNEDLEQRQGRTVYDIENLNKSKTGVIDWDADEEEEVDTGPGRRNSNSFLRFLRWFLPRKLGKDK